MAKHFGMTAARGNTSIQGNFPALSIFNYGKYFHSSQNFAVTLRTIAVTFNNFQIKNFVTFFVNIFQILVNFGGSAILVLNQLVSHCTLPTARSTLKAVQVRIIYDIFRSDFLLQILKAALIKYLPFTHGTRQTL